MRVRRWRAGQAHLCLVPITTLGMSSPVRGSQSVGVPIRGDIARAHDAVVSVAVNNEALDALHI